MKLGIILEISVTVNKFIAKEWIGLSAIIFLLLILFNSIIKRKNDNSNYNKIISFLYDKGITVKENNFFIPEYYFMNIGARRLRRTTYYGNYKNGEIIFYEYFYGSPNQTKGGESAFFISLYKHNSKKLASFKMEPRNILVTFVNRLTGGHLYSQGLKFDNYPLFNAKYCLTCNNEEEVKVIFHPYLLQYILSQHNLYLESLDNTLGLRVSRKYGNAKNFNTLFDRMNKLIELFFG